MFKAIETKQVKTNSDVIQQRLIMIVDDNLYLLDDTRQKLKYEGFQVLGANNGLDALMLLRKYKPDLIISDYVMPVFDGCKLLQVIKNTSEFKDIPFVLTSKLKHEKAALADYRLPKPYSSTQLLDVISLALAYSKH